MREREQRRRAEPGEGYDEGRGGRYGPAHDGEERPATWVGAGVYAGTPSEQHGTGPHAGKGPKNYRRADARVLEDVSQALHDHADVDASEIEVACEGGVVTLRGGVGDRRQKRLAEDCAQACAGVQDVQNELRVQDRFATARPTSPGSESPI